MITRRFLSIRPQADLVQQEIGADATATGSSSVAAAQGYADGQDLVP